MAQPRPHHESHDLRASSHNSDRNGDYLASGHGLPHRGSEKHYAHLSPESGRGRPSQRSGGLAPPSLTDLNLRAKSPSRRTSSRRVHRWPPLPLCEDEITSLSHESAESSSVHDIHEDEVVFRGRLDQEPVIEDVVSSASEDERHLPGTTVSSHRASERPTGIPTPPSSEDERARRVQRRPSRLRTDLNEAVPEVGKRTSSPYTFAPVRNSGQDFSGSQFLSPTGLQPPASRHPSGTRSQPSSPNRDGQRDPFPRDPRDHSRPNKALDDNAIHSPPYQRSPSEKRATYPPIPSPKRDRSGVSSRSVIDGASRPHTPSDTPPLPAHFRSESLSRGSPTTPTTLQNRLGVPLSSQAGAFPVVSDGSAPRSRPGSRNVSPGLSGHHIPPSPPRSPRDSVDLKEDVYSSRPVSQGQSKSGSRPSTPSGPNPSDSVRLPGTDADWDSALAANAARRAKPPSRLSMSMRQASMPEVPQSASVEIPHIPRHNALPYPLHDGPPDLSALFPNQNAHLAPGTGAQLQVVPENGPKTLSRSFSPPRQTTTYVPSEQPRLQRPHLVSHHSVIGVLPVHSQPSPHSPHPASDNFKRLPAVSSETRQIIRELAKKGLPSCNRSQPTAGRNDWYSLKAEPSLKFCPHCVGKVFEGTLYRSHIRLSPPVSSTEKIQCALGGKPWIRLAWEMTLQQRRPDLELLNDMVTIERDENACPGPYMHSSTCHGILDHEGNLVQWFHICSADMRKVESLFPPLASTFVELPERKTYICSLHVQGNRFRSYAQRLVDTYKKTVSSSRPDSPDLRTLIEHIRHQTRRPECPRDVLVKKRLWHVHPDIPHFTVCEDCYDKIVRAEQDKLTSSDKSPSFLRDFSRKPVPAPKIPFDPDRESDLRDVMDEEYLSDAADGHRSCQLYSPYLRNVLYRAIDDNDARYLRRKARDRRAAERDLVARLARLQRHKARLEKVRERDRGRHEDNTIGADLENDRRQLEYECLKVRDEWVENWEES